MRLESQSLIECYVRRGQTIILRRGGKPRHVSKGNFSKELAPVLRSVASHRSGASLVARDADAGGCPMVQPTDHRGAHGASRASLDSPDAVSRTLRIRSAEPYLAQSPACRDRCGRRALLSASWIRLARNTSRCERRRGRRPPSRRVHHYAATCEESFLRNGPLCPAQGSRSHACSGGRAGPRQAAYSGALPQCGRVGTGCLWGGGGV